METGIDEIERVDELDEAKVLGYFETVRSVFLLKSTLLAALESSKPGDAFHQTGRKPGRPFPPS